MESRTFREKTKELGYEINRKGLLSLQVNVGYRCNLSCTHCHLSAGPNRKESMDWKVMADILRFVERTGVEEIDITGGSPEMNPSTIKFISEIRHQNIAQKIILRTNLCILNQDAYTSLPQFLYQHQVNLLASLPCYLEDDVDQQRGNGVFQSDVQAIRMLNRLGYGKGSASHQLYLVHNPPEVHLPTSQSDLELVYKRHLQSNFGITFDRLFTITNMPIGRFREQLIRENKLNIYLNLLRKSFNPNNLDNIMCKYQLNVDWQGFLYDCDFNQSLRLPIPISDPYIGHVDFEGFLELPIVVGDYCFGCCAGAGSSCKGSLT